MATRTSFLRYLTAALVAGFALSLAHAPSAIADDDPGAKRKRPRVVVKTPKATYTAPRMVRHSPRVVHRVRTVVQVRTVERVRTRLQRACYDYAGRPFDCRMPAPVAPRPAPRTVYVPVQEPQPQPVVVQYTAPVQYQADYRTTCGTCTAAPIVVPAPRYHYGTGCGTCTHTAAPYYWTARYRQHVRHYQHRHHHY